MAYVPPKRRYHKKAMLITVLVVAVCICAGLGYQALNQRKKQDTKSFTICGFNEEKTTQVLSKLSQETYTISDYGWYGESLNVFHNDFALGGTDDVRRKSIELYNLCNEEAQTYTMETSIDRQIEVSELEPGFYTMMINDQLVKKRLVYDEVLKSEPFTTIARNGKVKKVSLLADQSLTSPALPNHILFLQIEEAQAGEDEVDVFLDPYGDRMIQGVLNSSGSANGLNEAEEMQKAAQSLREKLEGYGLRVAIAKEDAHEALGYYGEDSLMERAYKSGAKYYLELGMNSSPQSAFSGTEIYYSNHVSNTLANALMYALKRNTNLSASNAYTWNDRSEGVATSSLTTGVDGEQYDLLPALRESGGKFTGAARFSDAATANTSFALSQNTGMYALSINFIYLSNPKDANIWKEEQDIILTELAEAFVKALHLSEE